MKNHRWTAGLLLAVVGFTALLRGVAGELVPSQASWRIFPGRSEASTPDRTAWRQPAFDDSSWAAGPAPFFYGEPLSGTELGDMSGQYSTLFMRHAFQVDDPNSIGEMTLQVLGDDGYVVWLNGREIVRFNVPEGELAANAVSSPALPEPLATESFPLSEPWKLLSPGKNVLAIQALNASLDGPDFLASATLDFVPAATTPPVVAEQVPPVGSTVDELSAVEVFFNTAVAGVDSGDLLANGSAAASVQQVGPTHFVFSYPDLAAGNVVFLWKDGHGITDVQGQPQSFAGGTWTVKLDPTAARKNLMISEFMADNDKTLFDEDCENSDWIEIYNSGATAVNLKGWALTDDAGALGKWRFPDYTLPGGNYLVVFASQKNRLFLSNTFGTFCRTRTNKLTGFHTNFRLSASGEYLALVAPDGEVVSEFSPAYPEQRRDVSFGRILGTDRVGYFSTATPKAANVVAGDGFTPPVVFSRPTGPFLQPFALTLSCAATNAIIRYSLDGTFPSATSASSFTYTAPLNISSLIQVRARAFAPNLLPSAPHSETYLALTNSPGNNATLTSTIPIVVLTTYKTATIRDSQNTPVHISIYEPVRGLASLKNPPTLATRGGIKTRGSSTGAQPQSNFAVDLWDEFDQDHDLKPFDMPEDSEWVLYAPNGYDAALIHNPFTMDLSLQMGSVAPKTRFVEVYLNKGGPLASNQWFGLYVWMEKPGLSKGRVNAPKAQPEDIAFPEVTGSYLFKTDRLDPGDGGFSAGGAQNAYVEPKEREMKTLQRAPQVAYLAKYFKDMDNALRSTNPDYRDPVKGYKAYLDTTNWIDFHILETLSGQADAIRLSTYFYKRREGKLEYGPRWDYDRAWESKDDNRDDNPRIWDTGGGLWGPPWWGNFLRDTDAMQVWVDRWQGFRRHQLSLTNMYALIDKMTNEIRYTQPRENAKYSETRPRLSYANEIRIMKTWISNRVTWLDGQMAQPPRLSSLGGNVISGFQLELLPPLSMSNPNNVAIFYTLDGTDPRPSTGTGALTGFRYTGPITITANSRVFARVRDTGRLQRPGPPSTTPWSSGVLATFVVTPPPLILTEIMFHPDKPAGALEDAGEYEYLELKNISNTVLDLNGYHFTDGIEYRFTGASDVRTLAPGARVLLVRNRAAFLSRYPGITNVAGEFIGGLADAGERLALAGPVEEPIFEVAYGDQWQPLADGFGFSLVLADESISPTAIRSAAYWRLSAKTGGSPGQPDPQPFPIARVVVSEVQPQSLALGGDSQLELQNLESTTADVSGWWLTDDFKEPRKARLAPSSRLTPGGFLIVRESVFNLPNGAGFKLSARGDAIWLFSADNEGNLTGWHHGFEFGASEPNQSFGRHVTSRGTEVIARQKIPTLGAANTGPVVGPVALAEVFYHPADFGSYDNSQDEFIEIRSISDTVVPLFDPLRPTNTWRLSGSVELNLPPGLTLPPRGGLILVGFDTVLNPATVDSLRKRAGLDPLLPVVGPWTGTLGDSEGVVRLERPGTPIADNASGIPTVPYLSVDQVQYEDHEPWPHEADGTGAALLRRNLEECGDEPANWLAALRVAPGIDSDDDGLPNTWEQLNRFNIRSAAGDDGADGDVDGDGFTNRQEYLNGTDPRDPTSALRIGVSYGSGNFVNLFLAAPAGRKFRIESRTSLAPGAWTLLGEIEVGSTGVTWLSSVGTPPNVVYFRVVAR